MSSMTPHSSSLQSFLKDCIMNWSFMTKANSLVMPWREAVPLSYPLTMKLVPKPTVVWRMCPYGGGFMNPVTGWTACWQTKCRRKKPSFGCNCAFKCMQR